jgi:hypothetical protein
MISGSNRTSAIYANGLNIRRVHSRRSKGVPRVVSRFVPGHGTLSGTVAGTLKRRYYVLKSDSASVPESVPCPGKNPETTLGTPLERPWNEEEMLFSFFQDALKNANPPPQRGVDGERYIGPATWLDRQPMSEVDTYEKLCVKLRAKFSRAATRDKHQVMRELQRMTFKTFECILGWEPMIRTRNVRSALKRFARVIRLLTKALPSGAQAGAERKLFHHRSS